MLDILLQLALFTSKAIIIVLLILIVFAGILTIIARGKEKLRGRIVLKNLNEKYKQLKDELLFEILPKKEFKKFIKEEKKAEKHKSDEARQHNVFLVHFHGDIKASAVEALREEVTAILTVATEKDEVVVCVESAGGMVNTYGLAAAQLARIKQKNIPLTVIVDKIAASGGYLMACIGNKILAAPFAIIGSIGVIFQLPNFHRLLNENNIDFEQVTAGSFKRTLTLFGKNTPEAREKLQHELEDIHGLFKNLITENRKDLDIHKVSTGEHWLGSQALALKLVDGLTTSDDYLYEKSRDANVYQITYCHKKTISEKLGQAAASIKQAILGSFIK